MARYGFRPHDWASLVLIGAAILSAAAFGRGETLWGLGWGLACITAGVAARRWSRRYAGPMPYSLRWTLFLVPHASGQLRKILEPKNGERILEIGPGMGHHALAVAPALSPDDVVCVLDIQQEMLDALLRRARDAGVTNIEARCASADKLPYPDESFDAAYLSAVLGEIPDPAGALCELRRVLKPNGRLIVVEGLLDPDYVSLSKLREQAADAGFVLDRKLGPSIAYMARFRPETS